MLFTVLNIIISVDVSFVDDAYIVREDEGLLTVSVERYGNTESGIVVLIANHPTLGTATGR